MNAWAGTGFNSGEEYRAVSGVVQSVGMSIMLQLDDVERLRLAELALRMYRRGFSDPAKLRIICRTAALSWTG